MPNDDEREREAANHLPRGAALSWGLEKLPQRGPKRELSIAQIVETAVAIADKDGLAAVSMNRVASALGYTAMSLYRYIPSKADLLLLMQDAVCDIPLPPENERKDWREGLREYVWASIRVFREHPWFGDIPISGIPVTPNNLRIIDWVLGQMKEFPFNDYEKMSIILLLSSYARASGMVQRDMDRAIEAGGSFGEFSGLNYTAALKQLVTEKEFPNLHPVVMSGAYTGESENENTVGDDFHFGLERILDGVEYYLSMKLHDSNGK